jgi:ATP-dependent DNA helicase RecQ
MALAPLKENEESALDYTVKTLGLLKQRIDTLIAKLEEKSAVVGFDLLPLVRQYMLQSEHVEATDLSFLNVVAEHFSKNQLSDFGLQISDGPELHLTVIPWVPDWLPDTPSKGRDYFDDCFQPTPLRNVSGPPADPIIKSTTGHPRYLSPGQKEAVIAAHLMPEGTTLIVNLPTGSGKSLVGQLPLISESGHLGLTIFIVPTIALAIDQCNRARDLLSQNGGHREKLCEAWHSGLDQDDRRDIWQKISAGQSGILFVSPEALMKSLKVTIMQAASAGLINYIVVDEAHLISEWGDDFRPEFQSIAGLRRSLLETSGGSRIRTLLLSATYTADDYDLLSNLFGPPHKVQSVACVHLRPEPRYACFEAKSEEEKQEKLLELIKFTPRPFILYVTKRHDATKWQNMIQLELGLFRSRTFTGGTGTTEREEIIRAWMNNEIDFIVATSAFGVGMDKSDIRSIIHATVPESANRYYQEVGRSGRDGYASVAICIFCPEDEITARKLARPQGFSAETAFLRWRGMFEQASRPLRGHLKLLDLTRVPPHLSQQSRKNDHWNLVTLILMARAKIIELNDASINEIDGILSHRDTGSSSNDETIWEISRNSIAVDIIDPTGLSEPNFINRISKEIHDRYNRAERGLKFCIDGLRGRRELSEIFSAIYQMHNGDHHVLVSKVCRGCPSHPYSFDSTSPIYSFPACEGITNISPPDIEYWMQDFPNAANPLVVLYPGEDLDSEPILKAFDILISTYGIREIAASRKTWATDKRILDICEKNTRYFIVTRSFEDEISTLNTVYPPVPRLSILTLAEHENGIPFELENLDRPIHVIFAPDSIRDGAPHKYLRDIRLDTVSVHDFIVDATR